MSWTDSIADHNCNEHIDISKSCSICETRIHLCHKCGRDVRLAGGMVTAPPERKATCRTCMKKPELLYVICNKCSDLMPCMSNTEFYHHQMDTICVANLWKNTGSWFKIQFGDHKVEFMNKEHMDIINARGSQVTTEANYN